MKKNLLLTLPLLLAVIMVNAQVELTTYRGAFAPAPTRMWTENWTNWDPQNTVYPASNVNISGVITGNVTWTSNNVYLLQGLVYVDSLATLTIQPGTIIKGDDATAFSSLIVQRGGKLIAEGTQCQPIVFTTEAAAGARVKGQWGGVILLGRAKHNLGAQNAIEGIAQPNARVFHGGNDDDDNSGVLKYVRIEYGGYVFAANNEINGLTMSSVGRGTTIDYVQVSFTNDDAFEWFGGSVNCKHLVAYRNLDDDFDTDNGFSGTVQFCLGVRDPAISDAPAISTSEGFESDNEASGATRTLAPKTSAYFYNVTQIGAFRCSSNSNATGVQPTADGFRRGARFRRGTDMKIYNSILMNNWRGVLINDAPTLLNFDEDSAVFRNNIIAGDFSSTWTAPYNASKSLAFEDVNTRNKLFTNAAASAYAIDSVNTCSLLTNAWSFTNPDYRPNTAGAGAIITDVTNLNAGVDLSPGVLITGNLLNANETKAIGIFALENGGGTTNGAIMFTIAKLGGFNITVPGITLTSSNQSGINGTNAEGTYTNANWLFKDDGANIVVTSKPGVVIEKNGFVQLGFNVTRPASTPAGTSQNLSFSIGGGSDVTPANNGAIQGLGTN
jgi:hypothetical protein